MVIATVVITLNDSLVKLLSPDFPLHQIIFIRSVIGLAITLAVIVPFEGGLRKLRTKRPFIHIARGVAIVGANATFFAGLVVLPIGTAVAVFFIAPMLITALSSILLKERVNIYRWAALLVGFSGVFLIVQPGTSRFEWTYLLPILAAVFYSITNTLTRSVGVTESASSLSFYIQLSFLVMSIMLGLILGDGRYYEPSHPSIEFFTRGWVLPTEGLSIFYLGLGGICAAAGGFFLAQAYRHGEAGLVTPFEYTALILAVFWGYLFWQEIPELMSGLGMVLILGSGVFVLMLEAKPDLRIGLKRLVKRKMPFQE